VTGEREEEESFNCMPLKKDGGDLCAIKKLLAPVCHRLKLLYPLCHSVHDPLEIHRYDALTCGTGHAKCLSYPY
jgi:hypothetical protein